MNNTPARKSRVELPHGKAHAFGKLANACRPRRRLTVSQWADNHRILSSKQSGESGRWRTSRNPMLREIMDALSVFSPVREVVVMKSSQVGVTEAIVNWLGYVMDYAPAPAMVFMPTLEMRDAWKTQKLNPLLTDTQAVRDVLGGRRSRDAANRQDLIDFPGGMLFLSGGNSPNSYRQRSAKYLVMDDFDAFPAEIGDEGDPATIARGRVTAFPRHKLVMISKPTIKDSSLIEREYEATDKRRYHVACPACGGRQHLKWVNLRWNTSVTRAWYECEHCQHEVEEHHKPAMLAGGEWVAERPEVKRRGYHISALYAPIGLGKSWLELATEWTAAKDDPGRLKAFVNDRLGETWEDRRNTVKPHELAQRMEDTPQRTLPPGCLALTIGVDTQDDWLAVHTIGHGANHLWVIEYHEIPGDTRLEETWDRLEEYLNQEWTNAFGKTLRPRAAGIDSRGHRGEEVRSFVQRQSLKIPVFALQGSTSRMQRPIALTASHPDKTRKGRVVRGGYATWNVGTEYCKDFILGRLAADAEFGPEDRYIRFPSGLDDAYFNGLLSEVYDPQKRRYVQKKGAAYKRNEPLDTFVYAWAIANHRQVNLGRTRTGRIDPHYWERLEAVLEPDGSKVHVPASAAKAGKEAAPKPPKKVARQQPPPTGFGSEDWNGRF